MKMYYAKICNSLPSWSFKIIFINYLECGPCFGVQFYMHFIYL